MNEIELFNAALKLSATDRVSFLDLACKGNPELRRSIDELLQAHSESGTFLNEPDGKLLGRQLPETMASTAVERPGIVIAGRYKLLEAIGEGGMGSVWVAEQSQPVKRKVALKLIKAGMDSKTVLARFEAERQALAVMDHPNIAKVLDGGLTEQGRPFFVMEYVKGIPITEYCDAKKLSVPERLQLFAQVCQAVQHAHQKGIIHRDLKPTNILVAPYDDKPVPKVIDFGLAKAIHQSLTDHTLHTGHDMVLGTPLYMSPEQAQLNNIDIDTRSDVYSLGVLLYELLTGSTPLEKQRFKQAAWDEMRRLIREEDPPRPSQRLSSSETLPSLAAGRHSEPARLTKLVRGELDWIVMKALDKDRTRRYETANGFAADVLRYLAGEPVTAAPPSTVYRLQKLVRRNQGKVIAAGLVLAALLAGMVGTSWQWYRAEQSLVAEATARQTAEENQRAAEAAREEATRQQTRAEEQEAEALKQAAAAKEQEAEAKRQAEIAEAVAKFQTDMLAAVDPNLLPVDPVTKEPMKDAVTVVQALEAAVKALDQGSLNDKPLVEANVRNTIGSTFLALARYSDAEPNLRASLALSRAVLPAEDPRIAACLNNLAELLRAQNKLAEAEPLLREALQITRAALPAGDPLVVTGLNNLALLLLAQNKLAEAESLIRESLEISREATSVGDPLVATVLNNLSGVLKSQDKLDEAELLTREALTITRATLPAGHPEIAVPLSNLAELLRTQNKLLEAEPLYREALEIRRAALPPGHPFIAESLNNLALLLLAQNKLAEAEPLIHEALSILREALPAEHPNIAMCLINLATLRKAQNDLVEAESIYREAISIWRAIYPQGNANVADCLYNLALLLKSQKRFVEAEPLFREALAINRKVYPSGHLAIGATSNSFAVVLHAQRKLDEAESLYREALKSYRGSLPSGHRDIAIILDNFGVLLMAQNKLAEAELIFHEALDIKRAALPSGHPELAVALDKLLANLRTQNKLAEAAQLQKEALELSRDQRSQNTSEWAQQLAALSMTLLSLSDWNEAEPLLRESLAIRQKNQPDAWSTFNTQSMLGHALLGQGKFSEAEQLLLAGYTGMQERQASIPPMARSRITNALQRLVQLYTDWQAAEPDRGYEVKAAQWQQELDKFNAALADQVPETMENK